MRYYWLALGTLGVWRLTHLLNAEDGPGDVLVRIRHWAGYGFWGSLLDCFYCLSLWISAPFAYMLGAGWKEKLLLWPALSGAAILLERMIPRGPAQQAIYIEDEEENDVLRKEQDTVSPGNSKLSTV
ncbi:MAG TPA: hypothetical protein VGY31_15295 [Terriglobia bacterium]|nr:hypothetical protein [Terriglobia bacterium]